MFSDRSKLIALAIVHVFETSKPLGDYTSVAVLNDGAGISYGINQFTHRSGSLYQVVQAYLAKNPVANTEIIARALPLLKLTTGEAIRQCSINAALKTALALAGQTPEMQAAQREVMVKRYLEPAIDACDGSHFTLPLSLAVIYDSINHGSYEKIRDRVAVDRSEHPNAEDFEKAWISDYVRERDQWLASVPRLASTRYRTRFFLNQIRAGNWNLDLPISVQGVTLTDKVLFSSTAAPVVEPATNAASAAVSDPPNNPPNPVEIGPSPTNTPQTIVQQKVPLHVTILAVFTFLPGIGINAGQLIQQKLSELTPKQFMYCVLALGLSYLAIWWLRHEHKAATQQTNLLIEKAADPASNTVELKK
jgi:hypothetical protein